MIIIMENKQPLLLQERPVVLQYSEIEALVQKHTASCHSNLTNEMSFLRELVHSGRWEYIEQLLTPLQGCEGHAHSLYLVYRQEYIELLMKPSSLQSVQEKCKFLLTKMNSLSPNKEEYVHLKSLSTNPNSFLSSHPSYSDWTIESSRGQLYHDLYLFLSRHMTLPHVTSLVQLVTRGLLYQLCERHVLERCGLTSPIATGNVLDLLSWLQQLSTSVYQFKFNTLPISISTETTPTSNATPNIGATPLSDTRPTIKLPPIIQSKTTPTLIRSIPMQVSCPVLTMPKNTPTIIETTPTITAITSKSIQSSLLPPIKATPTVKSVQSSLLPPVKATPIRNSPSIPINATPTLTATPTVKVPPIIIKATPPATPTSVNLNVTPPITHVSSVPLSASTPCDPTSYRHSNHQSCVALPTPIQTKEVWPDISLATTFTDKQVVRSLCFSTDGMSAIGANSHTLTILDTNTLLPSPSHSHYQTKQLLYTHSNYHRGSIYCLDWYGNSLLASGSNDQTIRLLSSCNDTFNVVGELKEFGGTVREVTFLPKVTTRHLIACGSGEHPLQIADIESLNVSRDFKPSESPLLSVATIDENTFITGSENGSITLWDLRCTLFPTQIYTNTNSITSLSIDHGTVIACGSSTGQCLTLSLATKGILNEWSPHKEECRSIRYSPDGRWLMSSSFDGTVCFTSTRSYEWRVMCTRGNKVIQSRWHPSGDVIGCASADKTATFWTVHYRQ